MSQRACLIPLLALALAAAACDGDKAPEQPAPEVAPAAPAAPASASGPMEKGSQQVAQGMQGMAQNMAQMMQGMQQMAAGAMVEPLHFRELYEALPDGAGWERAKPTGQSMNMPYKMSTAEAKFTKADANVKVTVVDGGWHPMMLAPYAMFLKAGFERETESGYEKSTTIAGNPGWEKWDESRHRGEMNMVVADRFLMTFNGDGLADMDALKALVATANVDVLTKAAADARAKQEAAAPAQ